MADPSENEEELRSTRVGFGRCWVLVLYCVLFIVDCRHIRYIMVSGPVWLMISITPGGSGGADRQHVPLRMYVTRWKSSVVG